MLQQPQPPAYKILLLDDNPSHLELIEESLKEDRERFELHACCTPREAIDHLAKEKFDAVLLDYRLPGTTGVEVLKSLSEMQRQGAPVIVMSSAEEDCVIQEALDAGAADFIIKTRTSIKTLPLVLRRRIEKSRAAAQLPH